MIFLTILQPAQVVSHWGAIMALRSKRIFFNKVIKYLVIRLFAVLFWEPVQVSGVTVPMQSQNHSQKPAKAAFLLAYSALRCPIAEAIPFENQWWLSLGILTRPVAFMYE